MSKNSDYYYFSHNLCNYNMRKISFLFCILIAFPINADIFKCQNDSGVVAFQSSPCGNNESQDIIKSKRRYLKAQTYDDLSSGDIELMFDDVMTGDPDATDAYARILKSLPRDFFSPDYKSPAELKRIEEERYRNSDIGRLQKSIDEQNDLLREQSIREEEQAFDNQQQLHIQQKSLRMQEQSLRRQRESIEELNRRHEQSITRDRQLHWEAEMKRQQDKRERDYKAFELQQKLDDIEYQITR